jgi:FixJ family two-component response regulator
MPGLSGKALASAITRRRPHTKVLFTSGCSYNVIVHQGILDEGVTLLEKPFSGRLLLETVREVIERCASADHARAPRDAGELSPSDGPSGPGG